ncbi:MAG: general secretion pathway protein GspK [Candidatus Rokuibacteriota bacterium]
MTERGFALIAVLLVLALMGVVGAEFAFSMRLEASAVRAYKEAIAATHLAEAAIEQAVREIAADVTYVVVAEDGDLTFYTRERLAVPRLPRTQVPLGPGLFSYRISDEEARLNLNVSSPERVHRLLQDLGLDKNARDVLVDSLMDWRDANEEHRLNGAESDDYYLKLPVPYRARNANLESVTELLQIRGVTPRLYYGAEGTPGLADLVTVKTPGQVNINTVSDRVLRAHGFADAEISEIVQNRRLGPYQSVGRFGGRGLSATTRTFRIEAEGFIDGRVGARLSAVIQARTEGGAPSVAVLEWSGSR